MMAAAVGQRGAGRSDRSQGGIPQKQLSGLDYSVIILFQAVELRRISCLQVFWDHI